MASNRMRPEGSAIDGWRICSGHDGLRRELHRRGGRCRGDKAGAAGAHYRDRARDSQQISARTQAAVTAALPAGGLAARPERIARSFGAAANILRRHAPETFFTALSHRPALATFQPLRFLVTSANVPSAHRAKVRSAATAPGSP